MNLEESIAEIANRDDIKKICEPNNGFHENVHTGQVLRILYAINLLQEEWEKWKAVDISG